MTHSAESDAPRKEWISDREYVIHGEGGERPRVFIETAVRLPDSVVLTLSCGHAVLRRPTFTVPMDRMMVCYECPIPPGMRDQ